MRNAWIIARRELGAIFIQPIVYIFAIGIIFITGLLFAGELGFYAASLGQGTEPSVREILQLFITLTLFAAPAVTMRLLSEEQRSGTMELLMTLPVRDGEVVLGKFISAFVFYLVALALTLIYPFILLRFGNPDVGPILSGYLGLILWGAALLSIGVFASALSENQIVAFMVAFSISLVLYLASFLSQSVFTNVPRLTTILEEMSLIGHQTNFLQGLILAKDVLYYLIVTAVALFAAARVLESRRWR